MVEFDEETGRYCLHDLARIFAASRLEAATKAETQLRHAERYQKTLWEATALLLKGGESIRLGLELFDSEWMNIQVGQAWAENHNATSSEIAKICSKFAWAGSILSLRLHPRDYIGWLNAALVAAREIKDRNAECGHLCNLGLAYAYLGDAKKAIEFHENTLCIAREIGNRRGEGETLGNLGMAYVQIGDYRKAIEFYENALCIAREIGNRRGEGEALGGLGNTYLDLRDAKKAIEFYENALCIYCEIGGRRGEGAVLGNLGGAYAQMGDYRKAIEFYEDALVIAREFGELRREGALLFNLSLSLNKLGQRAEAIDCARSTLKIYEQIESPHADLVRQQLADWQK